MKVYQRCATVCLRTTVGLQLLAQNQLGDRWTLYQHDCAVGLKADRKRTTCSKAALDGGWLRWYYVLALLLVC